MKRLLLLIVTAPANFMLENYDEMHAAFRELAMGCKNTRVLRNASLELYELMRRRAQKAAKESPKQAGSYYKKAAHYVFTLYKAAGNSLGRKELLWVGKALYETKSFSNAIEVLEKFLAVFAGNLTSEQLRRTANLFVV
jgi:tetratricopeptide (TPR) repeat protein